MVEAAPSAPLEVAEPDLLLELLVVTFDAPAQFGGVDELTERDVRRQALRANIWSASSSPSGHSISSHSSGRLQSSQ